MVQPAELSRRIPEEKKEKTPEERRRELRVIKGGGKKRWGTGAKAGAIATSTAAVVSSVVAALGETDNLPDSLQGFYNQVFRPSKVVEEKSEEAKGKYDVEEASEDLAKIVNETQKETPPVVEETPKEIEWEGIKITPIEGLKFDKGTFFAEAGNPYGLEAGEKAGVCIKDAVEINGVMESSIGLRPEVIEVMQKKIMEEEKEFRYPLPFDLEKAKGIKIKERKETQTDELYKLHDLFWDDNAVLEIFSLPVGTKVYSPLTTTYYLIWDNNLGRHDSEEPSRYALHFGLFPSAENLERILFKNERVDSIDLGIEAYGLILLPSGIEKNITEEQHFLLTEIKIGEPIAETSLESSILIGYSVCQFKNKDDKMELYQIESSKISKASYLGLNGLLKIIEDIPVFLLPYDKKS